MLAKIGTDRRISMILYDISVTLSPFLHRYPGDPPVRLNPVFPKTAEGERFSVTRLSLGSHSGTHIDAPSHLLAEGASVEEIPLTQMVGPCLLVDLSHHEGNIGADVLKKIHLKGQRRILFRTRNSALWDLQGFAEGYDALTAEGASYLVEIGVQLVGIDYLSIEPFHSSGEVHRILLEAEVVVLEGLNLSGLERGEYELICLPLKIEGADGAPCRAILRGREKADPPAIHHTRWPL
jgi:arylformamidase